MKKQITDDREDLKVRQEKYQLELKPKLEQLNSMETRVERVVEFCSQIQIRLETIDSETRKVWNSMFKLTKLPDEVSNVTSNVKEIQARIKQMEFVWIFFQRFVDEQGNDYLRIIRNPGVSLFRKLDAIEWLARYTEFISPDSIALASHYFKELLVGQENPVENVFADYPHTSDVMISIA